MASQTHTQTVGAGSLYDINLPLPEGRSRVIWDFHTDDYDIAFSATFLAEDAVAEVDVVPHGRVESQVLPHTGVYEGDGPGTLTLTWDNSFSTFRSKTLHYTVHVEKNVTERARGGSVVLPAGGHGVARVCETTLGAGAIIDERADGVAVVDLGFGIGYFHPGSLLRVLDPREPYEVETRFQLEREMQLRSKLQARGLSEVEEAFCDHRCLLRYLRARQWDVDAAHDLLLSTLQWRFVDEGFRPAEMTDTDMAHYLAANPIFVAGHDREGRPVFVLRCDKGGDYTTLEKLRVAVYVLEKAIAMLPEDGSHERITCIFDFKDFSALRHMNLEYARTFPKIFQNHYPERLHQVIMINAPMLFNGLWKIVSTVLAPETKAKVLWLKSDTDEASLRQLQARIGPEVLNRVLAPLPDFDVMMTAAPFGDERGGAARDATAQGGAGGAGGAGTADAPEVTAVSTDDVTPEVPDADGASGDSPDVDAPGAEVEAAEAPTTPVADDTTPAPESVVEATPSGVALLEPETPSEPQTPTSELAEVDL